MNKVQPGCYVCGSTKYTFRAGSVRDNPALKIKECCSCGLVYLSESGHINDLFYEKSGMHNSSAEKISPTTWLKECARDDERRVLFTEKLIKNKRILDFGCGAGGYLLKARKSSKDAVGIEPEKRLQPFFETKKLKVFSNIDELIHENFRIKFDVITLFHVLEHLKDPRETLKGLAGLLSSKGKLIIEVPQADDALLKLYGCEAFSHFTYWSCHLYLFTADTLAKLGKQAGFKVDFVKQVQRYPLSNHIYWLSKGKPGGHNKWSMLDSNKLNEEYEKKLGELGMCDTLIASFQKTGAMK